MIDAPLKGLLVVSLEQAVAAPLCTARLADAGARVIKIERADGDFARGYDRAVHGESAYFVWLNRGKESLVLDIKQPDDAALLHRIIAKADVFVQNLAPGAAARAGFGTAALRDRHPRLITCDISGYGEEGPYRDMKAYDLLIQCETGLADITGGPDQPGRVGVSIADIGCGMNAHAAILEALLSRARRGIGSSIAVSLFDGLAEWMAVPLLHQDYAGVAPARIGIAHASIAPYGAFEAGDGKKVVLSIQNEREWKRFCDLVIERPDLASTSAFCDNMRRVANRSALDAEIGAVFRTLGSAEIEARLRTAKIAFGALNSVAEFSRHPQLRRITVGTPTGPVAMPAPPAIVRDGRAAPGDVPAIGAHSAAIRAEFAWGGER